MESEWSSVHSTYCLRFLATWVRVRGGQRFDLWSSLTPPSFLPHSSRHKQVLMANLVAQIPYHS